MIIFICFYFIVFLLSFKIEKNKFNIFDFILLLILILFSGLRGVGVDYHLYQNVYNSNFGLEARTGIGFTYLMYFYKYILHLDYQSLIFTVSALTIFCIYYFLKKNTTRPGLAILIYVSLGFYTTSFNMFRQSLSIAMILIGSHFFNDNKKMKTIICYTIAFFTHSSSIIAIVAYLITKCFNKIKLSLKYMIPCSIIALISYERFFYLIINSFDSYSMYSNFNATPGLGTYMNVTIYLIFTIMFLIPKYNSKDYQYYNLFLIGVCIMILEYKNYLFFRIAFYFIITSTLMLTNFYVERKFRNRRAESLIFYLCLFGYFLVYISSFDGVLPYKLFFIK